MIFKLVVFLLAGAIINVAVASACMHFKDINATGRLAVPTQGEHARWFAERPQSFSQTIVATYESSSFGYTRQAQFSDAGGAVTLSASSLNISDDNLKSGNWLPVRWENRLGESFGWPSRSVEIVTWKLGIQPPARTSTIEQRSWRMLSGFAINTIFYAAIVWMLFAGPGAVRRRVRIKRGQCASCGYSLRESVSEKCPECGATLKQKAETQKAEME
jgi:predicted RNA-binding Zn-ribbon protein involved in translation (DUF1610 family)